MLFDSCSPVLNAARIVALPVRLIGPDQVLTPPDPISVPPAGPYPAPPIESALAIETPPSSCKPAVGATVVVVADEPRAALLSSSNRPALTVVGPLNVLVAVSRISPLPVLMIPAPAGPETTAVTSRSGAVVETKWGTLNVVVVVSARLPAIIEAWPSPGSLTVTVAALSVKVPTPLCTPPPTRVKGPTVSLKPLRLNVAPSLTVTGAVSAT